MASGWNVYLKVRTTILKIYSRDFIFWMFALTVYQQNFPNCLPLGSKIMTIFGACFVICLRLWLFWMFCIVLKILPWVCIILVNMNTDLFQKYCVGFKVFFLFVLSVQRLYKENFGPIGSLWWTMLDSCSLKKI